jgi:hypothetical protein
MEEKIPVDGAMGRNQVIGFLPVFIFQHQMDCWHFSITVLLFLWFKRTNVLFSTVHPCFGSGLDPISIQQYRIFFVSYKFVSQIFALKSLGLHPQA